MPSYKCTLILHVETFATHTGPHQRIATSATIVARGQTSRMTQRSDHRWENCVPLMVLHTAELIFWESYRGPLKIDLIEQIVHRYADRFSSDLRCSLVAFGLPFGLTINPLGETQYAETLKLKKHKQIYNLFLALGDKILYYNKTKTSLMHVALAQIAL